MPRLVRVVITDVAHHVTQRVNGRQFILASDAERLVYLDLLRQSIRVHELSVVGSIERYGEGLRVSRRALCGYLKRLIELRRD